jgi:LmbE family N-acetylglucosaminyl deacetylase
MKRLLFTATVAILSLAAYAQQVRPASSEKIYHEIAQLRNLVNVLYVAAHPDDENTRLLAWLVNEQNIHTAYLSLTRGDGGQNILGSEQGAALGLIRTHELMEARKIDGAEQYFSRAIDFGFSKNYEETFKHWPKYLLTYDVVWVMRKYRPDVVICRFPPDSNAGHGQHAASAIIAAEAFKKTGDKMQYTEQLKYHGAWQPKRLLLNTYRFGSRNTTSEDQFKLGVGQYESTIGMGVGELAGISRSVHKSQGAGTPSVPGVQTEYFRLVDGEPFTNSLFDGIDITWGRVGRKDIGDDLQQALSAFNYNKPGSSLPALLAIRKKIEAVTDEYWRTQKLAEIDKAILDCTGLMTELYTKQPQAVRGARLPFSLKVIARSAMPLTLMGIQWGSDTTINAALPFDTLLTYEHDITIPANTPITQPYWLANPNPEKAMFSIPNDTLLGLPETPNELVATLHLKLGDIPYNMKVPLSYKRLDPIKGDVAEQLRIVPDATITFSTALMVVQADGSVQADVRVHAYKDIQNAALSIAANSEVGQVKGINLSAGTDTIISITVTPALVKAAGAGDFFLRADLSAGGQTYDKALTLIQYSHLPALQYFTPPYAKVLRPTWKCTVKRIGYIEGAGDYMPTLLRLVGLDVTVLKESDLADAGNLKRYDAIVTGIRAANVEKRMAYWMPVLMQYVQNGGTLVMQYNTLQELSTTKLGPYPFSLSGDRVTEEDAKVTFIDTASRLLTYPNKITQADFEDWVQERGLYFPNKWDEHYTPLFVMQDSGEQPQKGSTLYAKYGKGNYIYTTLSFFRQLPAGNKGAIRLLMNMLSVGR